MTDTDKSLVWVIDGSLSEQLHKTARLNPASCLCNLGWDVTMVTAGVSLDEVDSRIKFFVLPWPNIYALGSLIYHLSILYNLLSRRIQANVLIFQTEYAAFLLPIALWRKVRGWRNTKVVMDTRSMPMDTTTIQGKLRALTFKLSHWIAAHLPIGQTAITREMVKTVGIPRKQLLGIWPSGVNVDEFAVSVHHRQWPDSQDPVRLMYIGVLRLERCLIEVIDAVLLAREKGLNVTLELVGDGSHRAELQRYIQAKAATAVKIRSLVPSQEVPFVLAGGHVGLLPFPDLPNFRVSSAIKLFEYLAAGMPIIATSIVAHTDVLENEEFVFWADDASPESLSSTISEACSRKLEFPELGAQAHAAAHNWTWEASAKKLAKALIKAVHNS